MKWSGLDRYPLDDSANGAKKDITPDCDMEGNNLKDDNLFVINSPQKWVQNSVNLSSSETLYLLVIIILGIYSFLYLIFHFRIIFRI